MAFVYGVATLSVASLNVVHLYGVHEYDSFVYGVAILSSFQSTLTPNPEKCYNYYSVMKQ